MPAPQGFIDEEPEGALPVIVKPLKIPAGFVDEPLQEATKKAAPYVGRAAAELPTILGGIYGGPLGAGLGYGVSTGLRSSNPSVFGKPPEDIADFIGGGGREVLTQGFLPKGIDALVENITHPIVNTLSKAPLKNFPGVRQGAAQEMTDQLMKQFGSSESGNLLAAGEKASSNYDEMVGLIKQAQEKVKRAKKGFESEADAASALDEANQLINETFGKNVVGKQLIQLRREFEAGTDVAAAQTYKQVANTALSDLTHVRNFKLATGSPREIEQLALNKLVTNGFKDAEGRINANQVLNELAGKNSEIYSEAISPEKITALKSLLNEIRNQEKTNVTDRIVNWSNGHLSWSLLGMKYFGATAAPPAIIAATNKGLVKLMENPTTAKLVVAAMRTKPGTPEGNFVSRLLDSALNPGGRAAQAIRIGLAPFGVPGE